MEILTDRMLIRELTADDWRSMQRIAEDFHHSEYAIYDMPLPTEATAIQALTTRFAASGLFFAAELRESREMIGYVCFHEDGGTYDLGYCFHSAFHCHGYAFESCEALMRELTQLYPAAGFTAGTALKNVPSCKLLRKLGFVLVETETLAFHKDENGNDIRFEGGKFTRERI